MVKIHELELHGKNIGQMRKISNFVGKTYAKAFQKDDLWGIESSKMMLDEDKLLAEYSKYFVASDISGKILGSIKFIKLNSKIKLPIEREFDLHLKNSIHGIFGSNYGEVVEVSRFACSRNKSHLLLKIGGRSISDALMDKVVSSLNPNDIIVASLDKRVLNYLRIKGFPFVQVGDGKDYLGSFTIPVVLKVSDIK